MCEQPAEAGQRGVGASRREVERMDCQRCAQGLDEWVAHLRLLVLQARCGELIDVSTFGSHGVVASV